jgi:heme-degrading monooxygenase HmoA
MLPNRVDEFTRFFEEEYRPAMAETEGFLKAELLQDMEHDHDCMMVLRFESLDAAASWRASSLHEELKTPLKSLYDGSELKVFEVVVQE